MRTQMMIVAIVATVLLSGVALMVGLVWWLGWMVGIVTSLVALVVFIAVYGWVIKPWHMRWGATDDEVAAVMPGDELVPDVRGATRAITIAATVKDVWPWLVQLGFGKAGWYSYDWIDNDFQRSADRILPEHQDLGVGDEILMAPGMGLTVISIDPPHSIVSMMDDGTTSWCLGLYPIEGGGTRLVSRWRPKFDMRLLLFVLIEPGTFVMEQKMLRTLRDRVENGLRVAQR